MPETIRGVLERIMFSNEENHFLIGDLRPEDKKATITVTGDTAPGDAFRLDQLADPDAFRDAVHKLRDEWVFNLGSSSEAGARAIAELARQADSRPARQPG